MPGVQRWQIQSVRYLPHVPFRYTTYRLVNIRITFQLARLQCASLTEPRMCAALFALSWALAESKSTRRRRATAITRLLDSQATEIRNPWRSLCELSIESAFRCLLYHLAPESDGSR